MSFFYDFLDYFNLSELGEKIYISFIFDVGVMVVGNVKIKTLSETEICLSSKKNTIVILGEELKIKTLSKGEIVVQGKIFDVKSGDYE